MTQPKTATGTYRDKQEIEEIFKASIAYHSRMFDDNIGRFKSNPLFHHWRMLIRLTDELINIPLELDNEAAFLSLGMDLSSPGRMEQLKTVNDQLTASFNSDVTKRFNTIAIMSNALHFAYAHAGFWQMIGRNMDLSFVGNAIRYFQSRRLAFGGVLKLIPIRAKGQMQTDVKDVLNQLAYPIDSCLVGYAGAYYHLLVNECLDDYEVTFDGEKFSSNFEYENLEGFFLEPERMSLMDQLELRPDVVSPVKMISTPEKTIFSFNEIANAMALFEGAFQKYKLHELAEFKELNQLFMQIARHCGDHYDVILDEDELKAIQGELKKLKLTSNGQTYVELVNDYAPFSIFEGKAYSTVVLLTRFIYRTLSSALMRNRSFAINSGFVFEDKIGKILEGHGYKLTGITRINHKEFDLITIKNGRVYNFQCKNNHIDIARTGTDYKLIGRLNNRLIKYYRKAIVKEEKREQLIINKTTIKDIEHFVISRYPVITRDKDIINFNKLEAWIKLQKH